MNIMELGAIGELVGGLAVVGTLLYLALQVRHSTRMAESSLYDKTTEAWTAVLRPAIEEMDLVIRGAKDFSALEEGDSLKVATIISSIFLDFRTALSSFSDFRMRGNLSHISFRSSMRLIPPTDLSRNLAVLVCDPHLPCLATYKW